MGRNKAGMKKMSRRPITDSLSLLYLIKYNNNNKHNMALFYKISK